MRKYPGTAGTVHRLSIESRVLRDNLLGDPSSRLVDVYVPAGGSARRLPLLVDLVGYTGSGLAHTGWAAFQESVPERLDRLIGTGTMPPVVVAFPDCFTRLGGNQYINSSAMGLWEDYLLSEMLPLVESRFDCGGAGHRGVFGKSSGGYGAMAHGLLHADVWSAAACHSGDMGFEWCYLPDLPAALQGLARHGNSIRRWWQAVEAADRFPDEAINVLNMLAMAASYDPDPAEFLGVRLPVTLDTCEIIPERWANWMRHDPLVMLESCSEQLRRLKALYMDCGTADQYRLLYGARRLSRRLGQLNIPHRYEEFEGTHSSTDQRMDVSLPFLARALSG